MPSWTTSHVRRIELEPGESDDLTILLNRGSAGDRDAAERAFEQVYSRLKTIAHHSTNQGNENGTLNSTSVVHEAYARLFSHSSASWNDRSHFFAVAAKAMRHVVIDHARSNLTQKRGGGWTRVHGSDLAAVGTLDPVTLIMLDDALTELSELSPRQARITELRFFAGLTVSEVAAIIGQSDRTVELEWRTARAWLRNRLGSDDR